MNVPNAHVKIRPNSGFLELDMADKDSSRKKKRSWWEFLSTFGQTSSGPTAGMSCDANQCSMPGTLPNSASSLPHQTIFTKESIFPTSATAHSNSTAAVSELPLYSVLPSELLLAIENAAKQSFLLIFLSSLTAEYITDYLSKKHYTPTQIYCAIQAIRALTVISLGASIGKTAASTSVGFFSRLCIGEYLSGYVTSATMLAYDLYLDPANLVKTSCAVVANIGSSLFANYLAHSLFAFKNGAQNDLTQSNTPGLS